jgi:hypothetical protein
MSDAEATLDEIHRIHDEQPQQAAEQLRGLATADLPNGRLPLFGFLTIHVLGEKFGRWHEAHSLLAPLSAGRPDAPLVLHLHAAAAAEACGAARDGAFAHLVRTADERTAMVLVRIHHLAFSNRPLDETATALVTLAEAAGALPASGLDERLAMALNNCTTDLLDRSPADPTRLNVAQRSALTAGAATAKTFWQRAGTWVQNERALYLQALVANRIGDFAFARRCCNEALTIIDSHDGQEAVDRVFLQLQLSAAILGLTRAEAAGWQDAGLRDWFADERRKLGHVLGDEVE